MVKKILQDVVPPERKSIRHIPISENRKRPITSKSYEEKSEEVSSNRPSNKRKLVNLRLFLIIVAVLLFLGAVFSATWVFSSATVTVIPKQITTSVNTIIQTGKLVPGGLANTIVTSTSTVSEIIPSTREETVNRKASGQIVIFNNFSSESQRLIKNTRFESTNGRIYKIDESIVVPGQKTENGKKIPGSITVTVYADVSGPEYNLPLSALKGDFSIPGFKGTPRYEAFYARQKTDISGGFSGIARVVDDAVKESVENRLKNQAGETLWGNIIASLPQGYLTFKNLYDISYSTLVEDNISGDGVRINVTVVGKAIAFDAEEFSGAIAKESLSEYLGEAILVANIEGLEITPQLQNGLNPVDIDPLTLNVKGDVHFVWQFDENDFKKNLMGKSKRETETVMDSYIAIDTAEVVVRPSWVQKYPTNPKKIKVLIKLD